MVLQICNNFRIKLLLRCEVTSKNLIFEVTPQVIQFETECHGLVNSANGSWFNFNQAKGCQVLSSCEKFSPEIGTLTGPNRPSLQTCSWAEDIPQVKTDFFS